MELHFRDGDIFLPVAETKFSGDIARFVDEKTSEIASGCKLNKNIVNRFALGALARNAAETVSAESFEPTGFASDTGSMLRQSLERSVFPASNARGVRQSELSVSLARLTV